MTLSDFLMRNGGDVFGSVLRHLELVSVSVLAGILLAVPLGILLSRYRKAAGPVLAFAGMVQTIPGLVMLGFALILFGIGKLPAVIVLSLYAVLPILRNTYTGIVEVDAGYLEAARGIGMTRLQMLGKVQLPLAMPAIIGGIRISTVYIVSWATLAGLIGAGGLGDLIWTGLSTYNTQYILAGAIPSAIMAFLFSGLSGLMQQGMTPRGLKGVKG